MEDTAGYRGDALAFLKKARATVGDVLEVKTEWGTVTGTVVPRYVMGDDLHVVLKLSTGYNVGLLVTRLSEARVTARGEKPAFVAPPAPKTSKGLPRVLILGTGGTIASRIDYRTGAVTPAVSAGELHALVPELSAIAEIEPEIMFNVLSEDVRPSHWSELAARVDRAADEGFQGVVITHGTDTLAYTAAALSFALAGTTMPVVLVGAQRSSDRPSSDATLNLIGAVTAAAQGPFSGVYVAMHIDESDERIAFHRGTRVRKNHTSRRDAFVSVGVQPAAIWGRDGFEFVAEDLPPRGGRRPPARPKFEESAALLKFYPSMPAATIRAVAEGGARGIVVEGTGLGHTSKDCVKALGEFVHRGGLAFMTSQCLNGRVDMNVYETGRDLLKAGVVPLDDMLPETALAKLMWVLGNSKSQEEAKMMMCDNVAGETNSRRFPE